MVLTIPMIVVIVITIIAIILFITELFPVDVTAILVMVSLLLTNILTPEEGLSGFSNEATITVMALLILSIGLQSTGLVDQIGERLETITGKSEWRISFFTIVIVGFLSAFMSNTAIVAIFMPIVIKLANFAKLSPSKFLMPLSFAAMIGGTSTVIGTSTNIIVANYYLQATGNSIGIFEFFYIGLIFFAVFILFMFFIGRHIVPEHKKEDNLTAAYNLHKYLTQIQVMPSSQMVGKKIEDTELSKKDSVDIIGINRVGEPLWFPEQIEAVLPNDNLLVKANLEDIISIQNMEGLILKQKKIDDKKLTSEDAILVEAIIGQHSTFVGRKLGEIDFYELFRAVPLAIRRSGFPLSKKLDDVIIQFGDVLLMEARRSRMDVFFNYPGFIALEKMKKKNFRKEKSFIAILIVLGVIIAAAANVNMAIAALTGCAFLFITGCVSMRYVYQRLEWRVIFLLAGILPLGLAVDKTGVGNYLAAHFVEYIGASSPTLIISLLFLSTTLLTSFMSNNATAILLAPIAINLAHQLGFDDPKPFVLTIMFAASTSFLTPIGYQTNTLVYGAGQYTFSDFLKVGGLLTLIVWLLATFLIPYFYF